MATATDMVTAITNRIAVPMREASRLPLTKIDIVRFVLVALFGAVLAYAAATSALTSVARSKNYETALAINGSDPTALTVKADIVFLARQDRASLQLVKRLARASLRSQAVNPRALRLIAYADDGLLAEPKSQMFIDMATRLSRRELGAQVWLIEKNVAADDAAGALRHYDIALRTNTAIQLPLYTQLTAGIELPIIRQALMPYVRADTPWMRPFLTHVISNSANPASIVAVVESAGGMPSGEAYRDLEKLLLKELLAKGHFAVARDYYLGFPSAKSNVLRSVDFDVDNMWTRSGPLGWQLVQGASTGSDWSGNSSDQALAAFANSGERGVIARKWLFLAPGKYRIDMAFGISSMPPTSAIEWSMNCLSEAQPVSAWRSGPLRPVSGTKAYGFVNVTPSCRFQLMEIAMVGGESQNGAELVVESLQISGQR